MSPAPRILIAEDEPLTRQSLTLFFTSLGYDVKAAASGQAALALLEQHPCAPFDVVLTDILLGDISGLSVLAVARSAPCPPEVIMMTGYGTVETVVQALRGGAHDYLLKPCDLDQLQASAGRAIARRRKLREHERIVQTIAAGIRTLEHFEATHVTGEVEGQAQLGGQQRLLHLGPLQIDRYTRTVTFAGQPLRLTPTEYILLHRLAETPSRVQTYGELVRTVYGHEVQERDARALLKGHIHNLRAKLPSGLIEAVRGVGYMLVAPLA